MPRRQVTYSNHPNHRARMVHAQGERQFRTYDTSHIRPRKSKVPMVVGGVIAIVAALAIVFGVVSAFRGCTSSDASVDGSTVVVESSISATVPSGSSASEVASILKNAGVIPDVDAFLSRAKTLGLDSQFQAGSYTFSGGMTLDDVIQAIATGDFGTYGLTIPEGYKLSDIASAVESATSGRISASDFIAAASDASVYASEYDFLADAGSSSLEGFLFPKTYSISDTDTADSVIRMMLNQFKTETAGLDWSYAQSRGLSIYDAVTLASIVEKESSGDGQIRAQVAAVFYNRLSSSNTETFGYLQSDATTAYEVGHDPSADEVQAATPYSTYSNPGLPPTPICSPGLDCLQAVCSPASDYEGYYYFIFWQDASGAMQYQFSQTYAEHQAAIAEHL